MIISGNFIALQKEKDFIGGYDGDEPVVVWINVNNIVQLNCYDDGYELILPGHITVLITSEAASEIIKLMRSERDEEVKKNLELLKKEPGLKEALKFYFRHAKEDKDNGNEK